jgi:hypothetical protein
MYKFYDELCISIHNLANDRYKISTKGNITTFKKRTKALFENFLNDYWKKISNDDGTSYREYASLSNHIYLSNKVQKANTLVKLSKTIKIYNIWITKFNKNNVKKITENKEYRLKYIRHLAIELENNIFRDK